MKVVYLTRPVTLGERTVSELHFKEPTLMHMMRTDGHKMSDISADAELVSALTGEPVEILKHIHIEDWAKIRPQLEDIYAVFFGFKEKLGESKDGEEKNPTKAED